MTNEPQIPMSQEDAQTAHDRAIAAALKQMVEPLYESFDPIENAMRLHPKLTRETAEKMAEEFGF